MTSQLTKDVKTHIVVTYSNIKHYITSEQELNLRTLGDRDKIYTDTGLLKINNIKDVLSVEEYYNNNPKERPQFENISYKEIPKISYSAKRNLKNLKTIRDSFLKYFNGRELKINQQEILKRMNFRIDNFKVGDIVSPSGIFFGIK